MAVEQVKRRQPVHYFQNFEGLNTQSNRYSKNGNQALVADNVVLVKRGFQDRGGQELIDAGLGIEIVYGLEFVRTVGGVTTRQYIGFGADGIVYHYSGIGPVAIYSGLTAGVIPDVIVARGWMCFSDGVTTPQKYDMTNVFRWGIVAPATAPTLAAGAAGLPNGTYRFRIAYRRTPVDAIDPGSVSSMGLISAPITVTNDAISLTAIPVSADPQVDARDVYVEIGGQWYLAGIIPDNTTTIFTYDALDSTTVLSELGRTDRDPPPDAIKIWAFHKDIVFGSDGRTLAWSSLNEFESFSQLQRNSNAFQTDDGTNITALTSYTDLAIAKERSIYVRSGDDVSYTISKKITDSGIIARNSVIVKDNILYYLAHDGFRVFDGNLSVIISRNINNLLYGGDNEKLAYSPNIYKVTGVYFSNNNIESMIWTIPTATNVGVPLYTRAFCYYPGFMTKDSQEKDVGAWVTWSALESRFIFKTINATSLNDNLFTFGQLGQLRKLDTGYQDLENPIVCTYRQADQYDQKPVSKKRMRDIFISVFSVTPPYERTPTCQWYIDGAASGIIVLVNFYGFGSSRFDSAIFDSSRFASEGDLIAHTGCNANPFYTICPEFTWTVNQAEDRILWQGWTMRFIDAGYRRTP
jgi:hypothetical protein